jgi:hypothetical protein
MMCSIGKSFGVIEALVHHMLVNKMRRDFFDSGLVPRQFVKQAAWLLGTVSAYAEYGSVSNLTDAKYQGVTGH